MDGSATVSLFICYMIRFETDKTSALAGELHYGEESGFRTILVTIPDQQPCDRHGDDAHEQHGSRTRVTRPARLSTLISSHICLAGFLAAAAISAPNADAQQTRGRAHGRAHVEAGAATVPCVVRKITDGDTFTCKNGTKVRLLLIDAPEHDQKPFGAMARSHLMTLIRAGDTVRLETDVQRHDRYHRLLAYAYLSDGRMINEEMARAGYVLALSYPPDVRYIERIRKAIDGARAAKRGLWRTGAFQCTPYDHRRQWC